MGKPYWGYNNLLTQSSTTLSARTEDATYPVSNLSNHRLWPGYRSADKALSLNGVDEYCTHANHADFNPTNKFTLEFLFKPAQITIGKWMWYKADASTGYGVTQANDELTVRVGSTTDYIQTNAINFVAGTWYRVKIVYDGTGTPFISVYINGVEAARATNATQTGCTLIGTIPATIPTNTGILGIFAANAGGAPYEGECAFIGISKTAYDNGTYLTPSQCAAYYDFDDSDLTDSSGNGHTLTGIGIDSSNYFDSTAYQWVYIDPSENVQPIYLYIDRRHNLSSGATMRWLRGSSLYNGPYVDPYGGTNFSEYTTTVDAGNPVIIKLPSEPPIMGAILLEINDPSNPDGYIELPYVYLGDRISMQRAHLRGYNHGRPTLGNVNADSGGGYTGYSTSEKLWNANLRFRCNSTDYSTLQAVIDEARQMRPVVFCEDADNESNTTRLVYLPEAMKAEYQHIITDHHFVDIAMQEAGGGV